MLADWLHGWDPVTAFRVSRDLGCAYLLEHQAADGAFPAEGPSVSSYNKALSAFQVCGRNDAANRMCDWIRAHGLTPDGDIGPRPDKAKGYSYAYPNAWVVVGAHRLGQFDLSQRVLAFMLTFQDRETGGFYSSAVQREADTPQDLMVTSMCGLAALYAGHRDGARGVGSWLRTVRNAQPSFPQALYTVYSRGLGLCTDPPSGEVARYVTHASAQSDQHIFNPGIAAAFLCRLYQSTGDREWLDLSRDYMRVVEEASEFVLRTVRAGKVGWAASLLFRTTGDSKYRDMALRVGQNLMALQAPQGHWSDVGSTTPSLVSTAERVVWMDEIDQALGRRE